MRRALDEPEAVRLDEVPELDVDDDVDAQTLQRIAQELLANPVIEDWTVRRL